MFFSLVGIAKANEGEDHTAEALTLLNKDEALEKMMSGRDRVAVSTKVLTSTVAAFLDKKPGMKPAPVLKEYCFYFGMKEGKKQGAVVIDSLIAFWIAVFSGALVRIISWLTGVIPFYSPGGF